MDDCRLIMQACTFGRALLVLLLWFTSVSQGAVGRTYGLADQAVGQLQPLATNIMAGMQHRQVRPYAMHSIDAICVGTAAAAVIAA